MNKEDTHGESMIKFQSTNVSNVILTNLEFLSI